MSSRQRIDVHQHFLPPAYASWLRERGVDGAAGRELPAWSAEGALALMDQHEIAGAILSISTPGVRLDPSERGVAEARAMARRVNEFAAEAVRAHPHRFGFFATLTLPDVDGALAEAAFAFDVLVTSQLDAYAALDAAGHRALDRDNALALFNKEF